MNTKYPEINIGHNIFHRLSDLMSNNDQSIK